MQSTESRESARMQTREYRECENADSRVQSDSTESRVQRVRESKVESAEIVSAESVSTVRESSVHPLETSLLKDSIS